MWKSVNSDLPQQPPLLAETMAANSQRPFGHCEGGCVNGSMVDGLPPGGGKCDASCGREGGGGMRNGDGFGRDHGVGCGD